jgi:hypothetical protein
MILNSRTIGKITYHTYIGASIDDYCTCNSNFLQNLVSFNVGEFNPILSDHCPIHVKILSQFTERYSQDCLKKVSEKLNGMILKTLLSSPTY